MYRLYASMVQGPYRQELRTFFANEIPEELAHAQVLADKISALGGTPAATAAPVTVVPEAKAMLEAALKAEVETIDRYVKRRAQAEAAGEHGLASEFDTIIADESTHRDELRQMLARWPRDTDGYAPCKTSRQDGIPSGAPTCVPIARHAPAARRAPRRRHPCHPRPACARWRRVRCVSLPNADCRRKNAGTGGRGYGLAAALRPSAAGASD